MDELTAESIAHRRLRVSAFSFSFPSFSGCHFSSVFPSLSIFLFDSHSLPFVQQVWDRIQVEFECCGVDNPFDYNLTAWRQEQTTTHSLSYCVVPLSCRRSLPVATMTNDMPAAAAAYHSSLVHDHHRHHHRHHHQPNLMQQHHRHHQQIHRRRRRQHFVNHSDSSHTFSSSKPFPDLLCESSFDPKTIHVFGCYASILKWLQRATDILSVLGFCVITFLKICFTCILRYEIREMIQKIQMLKRSSSIPCSGQQSLPPQPAAAAAADSMRDTAAKNEDKI